MKSRIPKPLIRTIFLKPRSIEVILHPPFLTLNKMRIQNPFDFLNKLILLWSKLRTLNTEQIDKKYEKCYVDVDFCHDPIVIIIDKIDYYINDN